ncbi:MAG: hypothetical protein HZA46_20755 [Planctomycetales bacterium]|nr:hypothetical protein [Planctomycetales bacterium]
MSQQPLAAAGAQQAGAHFEPQLSLGLQQLRWYVNTFGQAGRQITGLQQVGWQEGAQPQLFSAPQQ